jgi:ADP-ribosylglycohydrolase
MNEQKIKGMLWGAIIGDAIGTPFDGLSKAHIRSTFKSINDYTDAAPALKGKPGIWKKSGLYSALSQLMILMSMYTILNKRNDPAGFIQFISGTPASIQNEYGIFRHPTAMLRHLINAEKAARNSSESSAFSGADVSGTIVLIPLSLTAMSNESQLEQLLSFSGIINKDIHSNAGTLIFIMLLRRLLEENDLPASVDIIELAMQTAKSLLQKLENIMPEIFNLGMNPDYLLSSVRDYFNILTQIIDVKNIDSAEKNIYTYVNTRIKTQVTRATINHPMAIIPFSLYMNRFYSNSPSDKLFRVAEYGGAANILCALTGALNGAIFGLESLPVNLLESLVNKKRITAIVESVLKEKITNELIEDFITSEASLSAKEREEKNAKLKHIKIKVKKKKSRHEMEKELSSHVVESWTKFDSAKWRRKLDRNPDNE